MSDFESKMNKETVSVDGVCEVEVSIEEIKDYMSEKSGVVEKKATMNGESEEMAARYLVANQKIHDAFKDTDGVRVKSMTSKVVEKISTDYSSSSHEQH